MENDKTAVRLTVSKALALEAQRLISAQGIDLNLTQAVNVILTTGIKAQAELNSKQYATTTNTTYKTAPTYHQ